MRLVAAALAALLLAGCAGDAADPPPTSGLTELLARAPERLREQATLTFTVASTRTRADRLDDPERYSDGDGALDLEKERGRLHFELDLGEGMPAPVEGPFELRWTAAEVEVTLAGERRRLSRSQARETGGLIGRLPDEPQAVIEALGGGRNVTSVGKAEIDGHGVAHLRFLVDARSAGAAGVPAEVAVGATQGLFGDDLPMEAWIDGDSLPRRIAYELRLKPVRSSGRLVLPARTVRVVYDLAGFGRPVSGLEFSLQAG